MISRLLALLLCFAAVPAAAIEPVDPQRSWTELVSANGYTGVVLDLARGELHHFREHIYATEEPRWREDNGEELWLPTSEGSTCVKPLAVNSRDLLQDAYFGVRVGETSTWLRDLPVDLDASGYDGLATREGRDGGTGIIRMVQRADSLTYTTRVFTPWSSEWSQFVMLLEVRNDGDSAVADVDVYGLVNTNLGYGRPGARQETGSDFETIRALDDNAGLIEQGFGGTLYLRPLTAAARLSHSPADFFGAVQRGEGDLPLPETSPYSGDGLASAMQWTIDEIPAGESRWVGLVVAHDPNPDFDLGRAAIVDEWVGDRSIAQIWQDERAGWAAFQDRLVVPSGLSDDEVDLALHSATVLRMAQVREERYWLRPEVDRSTPRMTGIDGSATPVVGDGEIREHNGRGAVLASLPPGEWAYAWVRDGAYAIVGLTDGGLFPEAREALEFYLNAEANRYLNYDELSEVPLSDYTLSLTRYHGFGIEESDTLCGGDLNFEWDGFGLYLWALRHYVQESGDTTLLEEHWPAIRDGIANVIEGLVVENGLLWPDSSIWEVHWFGKEKQFAYTSIAAARGLCDMAWMAEQRGELELAARYETSGRQIRRAIYQELTAPAGEIAANVEELATGTGYWDAAAIEAVAMGLFDPTGPTSTATITALRERLTAANGRGLFRNDDQFDAHDLSPYGSFYDSQEWVVLDFRMSIAARHAGMNDYADDLQSWVRDQSLLNFLLIGENYDEATGEYRNNAPMIGFGSGSYLTAMRQRAGEWSVDAACGVYFEDDPLYGPGSIVTPPDTDPDAGSDAGEDVSTDAGADVAEDIEDDVSDTGAEDVAPDTSPDAAPDAEPDAAPDAEQDAQGDIQPDAVADGETDTTPEDGGGDDASTDLGSRPDLGAPEEEPTSEFGGGGGCVAAGGAAGSVLPALLALFGLRRRRRAAA